jgi:hypothetical protein
MYCTNCGQTRPDDATACPNCGRRVPQFAAPPNIPNYLVQSILVTLCCCLPLGLVAVIYSAQVNGKLVAGDIAGAQVASRNAKMWAWIGFGLGVVLNIIALLFSVANGFKS